MIELQTMNEIPIYTIIKIEAEEAEIPMSTFYDRINWYFIQCL